MEMDGALVAPPGFKPACLALILSWVGSIPTHLRHFPPIRLCDSFAGKRVSD